MSAEELMQGARPAGRRLSEWAACFAGSQRVEHLLLPAQLRQTGHADERQCTAVLRAHHLAHEGAPPPRRHVHDPRLRTR